MTAQQQNTSPPFLGSDWGDPPLLLGFTWVEITTGDVLEELTTDDLVTLADYP